MTLEAPRFRAAPGDVQSRLVTTAWMGAAFCTSLGLAAIVLLAFGTGPVGTHRALKATARLSFLLFWPAYVGSALVTLFGGSFQPLARRGREFGLAFAAALQVHLGLVAWLYWISAEPPVPQRTLVFFAVGAMWTYLLALFSIRRLARALGTERWRALRLVGLQYIAFAFLIDFLGPSLHGGAVSLLGYLPFSTLLVVGMALRLAAWMRRTVWRTRGALRL